MKTNHLDKGDLIAIGAAVTAVLVAVVSLAVLGWFVLRPQVVQPVLQQAGITSSAPDVPPELADHQERAGLERGYQFGAQPAAPMPRPDAALRAAGIDYAFHESPNWSGRNNCDIQAIVLHITGPGSMAGMRSWFRNPASQVSAHFGIGKKGEVEQYVALEAAAWHAGVLNRPNLTNPLIANWAATGVNPNRCHVGIELLLAGPAEPLVEYPEMQRSLNALLAWLLDVTGLPADRIHIIGHYEIDGVNRSTDPRCCVDIDAVIAELAQGQQPCAGEGDPYWDDCTARWRFSDGRSWSPSPAPYGTWYGPNDAETWSGCDPVWNNRYSPQIDAWVPVGQAYFRPANGFWAIAPAC